MTYPSVTIAMLIYRSQQWLSFALGGLAWARNRTPYRVMVVGNDAEPRVMATGRVDIDHRNADPTEHYLSRVYRAWNAAVAAAETDWVVMINSDMYVSDYWLDALVHEKIWKPKSLPCSLLVESGRIPSAMPEYVRNLGTTIDWFDREAWRRHAGSLRLRGDGKREPGRLFMPVLVDRQEFADIGGYPSGNVLTPNGCVVSGDRILFDKYAAAGYEWVTCLDSVVYHVQEGEMRG